jgi:hypothetical protein
MHVCVNCAQQQQQQQQQAASSKWQQQLCSLSLAKKIQWLKLYSHTPNTHPSLPLRSRPIYSWLGIHYGRLVLTLVFKNRKRYIVCHSPPTDSSSRHTLDTRSSQRGLPIKLEPIVCCSLQKKSRSPTAPSTELACRRRRRRCSAAAGDIFTATGGSGGRGRCARGGTRCQMLQSESRPRSAFRCLQKTPAAALCKVQPIHNVHRR